MFLLRVCQNLDKNKITYALVGGYAVALHGAVRGTVDIDFVIKWDKKHLIAVEKCMKQLGLISKLPIEAEQLFNFRDEYINNRNLIAWNFYNPNDMTQQVDLIINHDLTDLKTTKKMIGDQTINILNKKDLITMKRQAGRPQDLEDIKSLEGL